MIRFLRERQPDARQVWLADDAAAGGTITSLSAWYRLLTAEVQKYDYLMNGAKNRLSVKMKKRQGRLRVCLVTVSIQQLKENGIWGQ